MRPFVGIGVVPTMPPRDSRRLRDTLEFHKFLDEVERNVPADLDVHVVMDNYGTHKTPIQPQLIPEATALASALRAGRPCASSQPSQIPGSASQLSANSHLHS